MANAPYPRAERVRAAIKHALAMEVERLKDPGLGFVTLTDVTLTRDLRHARAFYTAWGGDSERASSADALARATPHLRRAIAREVRLKFVPTLVFEEDPLPQRAQRIERLVSEIHQEEERP